MSEQPKLACICLTFDRSELLPYALYSYLMQDYPDDRAELLILDDAGQYRPQHSISGKPWELISVMRRFSSVGAKRNAIISLVSRDVDAIVIWDDDDIYLPWTLRAHAGALATADWSRPSVVLDQEGDELKLTQPDDRYVFHAAWAFRKDVFWAAGGYGDIVSGEDKDLAVKFREGQVKSADPLSLGFDPYFVFNRSGPSFHVSHGGPKYYHELTARNDIYIERLEPQAWPVNYTNKVSDLMAKRRDVDLERFERWSALGGLFL